MSDSLPPDRSSGGSVPEGSPVDSGFPETLETGLGNSEALTENGSEALTENGSEARTEGHGPSAGPNAGPSAGTRVLIVEDDEAMSVALRDGFEYEGYEVTVATDGETGLRLAAADDPAPELIILDVMLPRKSGLDVCKELRGSGNDVPIIMLTARGQEIDKVLGLKLGADDYITKPFGFMELLARAEAVLRRTHGQVAGPGAPESYRFGVVEVDFKHHEATRDGDPLELSPREFELLSFFIQHRGEVVTRERLLDAVWGYNTIPFTRTVDMHVAKLRKKIEDDPSDPKHIVTVHRLGYKFTG